MWLKLKHIIKVNHKRHVNFKAIDLTTIFDEDKGIYEWLDDPKDTLLDELDENISDARPNSYLGTFEN